MTSLVAHLLQVWLYYRNLWGYQRILLTWARIVCLNYHHITELNNLLTMQNDSNPMLLMVDLTNESFLSVWSVVIAMYVYIRYRSIVTLHLLACIFLKSRYSILFSRQVLAQILRGSSEESRMMLRTPLVELDHSSEFALSLEWLTRVVYCCWITRLSYSRDIKSLIQILLEL